jgi:hypothetical protein
MAYTTIDKPSDYFETVLYTGNNSSQAITGVGFQPDWIWLKSRAGTYGAYNPQAYDSVRGFTTGGDLTPANSNVEGVDSGAHGYISAVGADGFTLTGGSTNSHQNNGASTTYVAWNWKAGTSFSNSAGANGADLASTGSYNRDAGFSIVTWTGNATDDQQIYHGLNAVPKMMILKNRTNSNNESWAVYHQSIGNTKKLTLDTTAAPATSVEFWSDETPTSTVFTVGRQDATNNNSMIAYCFSEVKGYSKIGSYVGNGNADGTFVYTGFKPAFILIKRSSTAGNDWGIFDNKRLGFNVDNEELRPSAADAEQTDDRLDILSNGFKIRLAGAGFNASGDTFIYMAFAENPFVTSTGVPATAR